MRGSMRARDKRSIPKRIRERVFRTVASDCSRRGACRREMRCMRARATIHRFGSPDAHACIVERGSTHRTKWTVREAARKRLALISAGKPQEIAKGCVWR
ncbi:hypothetical protein [Burkholderia vietnamiensis]|uniref:hypothetical protein n=1 Tax=Burkholderia vietnamiensis TaxID=60552 RepID=UPI0012D89958|nr:hypothetical protein [Burkholderia vietnamiensis]